ncbi:glycosyltransferase [Paenibacillus sp. sgz5001063]|uniref:glycosyltransferase n=1 Tax=Paenibacillus sp. sgz5001063 TaxID=3242474 RepID=UPI0036D272AE
MTLDSNNLKNNIKNEIEKLAQKGDFTEAKLLIQEFRRAIPDNIEIFSIEAVVALMEGNLTLAEQVLRMGLVLDKDNADLVFNMAYLYELKRLYNEAIDTYYRARELADDDLIQQIDAIITNIQSNQWIEPDTERSSSSVKKPKVSVVIPTYNMKEYLQETINSILLQDFDDLEIIVGDDCSSDGTDEMMKQYVLNPKIRYIRNEVNLGAQKNCQTLLYEKVRGKYVLGINHDDYLIKSDYISKAVDLLEKNPNVSLVFANIQQLNMSTELITSLTNNLQEITNGIDYFLNYQTKAYPHIPGTLTSIYRLEDAKSMGCLAEDTLSQDTFLYLKLMLIGDVGFIHDHVGVYRVHEKSLSYNMPLDKDLPTIEEFERLYGFGITKGLSKEKMDTWLQIRVFQYIQWRFLHIWRINRKQALELLMSLSNRYLPVFNLITSNLQWISKS